MKEKTRLLMVDDHPMIIESYKISLEDLVEKDALSIDVAYSSEEAHHKLLKSLNNPYDIVFLDISMPSSINGIFLDGEDLGMEIKKQFPNIKILVLTMLNDNYRIYNLLKNLNPNGFLIKSELTPEKLHEAFVTLLNDGSYYCKIVSNLLRKRISSDVNIDYMDRKILYHLSTGEKMKNLPDHISLSMPSIERRKKRLKYIFEAIDGGDKLLLSKAKEKGFI